MALIKAERLRNKTFDITVNGPDGAITVGSNDLLRITIGREGHTPAFTLVSGTDSSNGSSITKGTPTASKNRIRLDASDLSFAAGTYTLYVDLFDNADAEEWKTVDRQVFVLEAT